MPLGCQPTATPSSSFLSHKHAGEQGEELLDPVNDPRATYTAHEHIGLTHACARPGMECLPSRRGCSPTLPHRIAVSQMPPQCTGGSDASTTQTTGEGGGGGAEAPAESMLSSGCLRGAEAAHTIQAVQAGEGRQGCPRHRSHTGQRGTARGTGAWGQPGFFQEERPHIGRMFCFGTCRRLTGARLAVVPEVTECMSKVRVCVPCQPFARVCPHPPPELSSIAAHSLFHRTGDSETSLEII